MAKLARILALPLVLILASAGSGSEAVKALAAGEPMILRVWNWEDYIGVIEVDGEEIPLDEYFEQYVKEVDGVDIDVIYETFDTNETMLSQLQSGAATYDLICPSDYSSPLPRAKRNAKRSTAIPTGIGPITSAFTPRPTSRTGSIPSPPAFLMTTARARPMP